MNLALLPSLILVLLSAGLVSTAAGGEPGPDLGPYREVIERLTRAALTERGTWRKLEELCSTAPHRLSGSPGAAAAVEWARQTMLRAGLENVRLEPCTVPHWTRGRICELRIVEPVQGSRGGLPALALGGSVPTPPSGITAEVVEVRSLEELEALGAQAHGRVIFFNRPMDPGAIDPFRAYGDAVDQRVRGAVA
ncbi:MAG: peptidase M28 family protein, partial [Planctomycetota bacterium]